MVILFSQEYYNRIERKNVGRQYEGAMYGYGVRGGYDDGVAFASYATRKEPSDEFCLELESFMEDLSKVGDRYLPDYDYDYDYYWIN